MRTFRFPQAQEIYWDSGRSIQSMRGNTPIKHRKCLKSDNRCGGAGSGAPPARPSHHGWTVGEAWEAGEGGGCRHPWRRRRCGRRGGRRRTGEFEDGDPGSGEVSDLHGIAPAVEDPRLPVDDPRKHALVFGDPGLDKPRHGGLTAHDLRAIADRASGLDATGHGASATSLSSSSTTQRPPRTPAHDRCTPPHRRSRLAATSLGLSLAVAELRQAAASPGPSLAVAELCQAAAVLSRCCGGHLPCRRWGLRPRARPRDDALPFSRIATVVDINALLLLLPPKPL
uniref:Uncharacterized protein n=1 Tax=Oryza sativa subsp. japonica TaxID=39947 RepID=Q6K2F1_ORYSJ|nr:hypothetical protein [Oryza sativa Japonica Group]